MSALEQRVKEAFDTITMPKGLRENTLEMLAVRAQEQGESDASQNPETAEAVASADTNAVTDAIVIPMNAPNRPNTPKAGVRERRKGGRRRKFVFAAAACLLLLVLGFGGFNLYSTETAIVSLELNPSIELGLNRFDVVIDARALNSDGEAVLSDVAVEGKGYDEALASITQSDTFLSYVTEDSFVNVYVICGDNRQSATLLDRGQANIASLPCGGACNQASSDLYRKAAGCGMGVGRYEAAQVLLSLDPTLTIEDCASLGIGEIRRRIAELDADNAYAGEGQGGNHGMGMGGSGGRHMRRRQ